MVKERLCYNLSKSPLEARDNVETRQAAELLKEVNGNRSFSVRGESLEGRVGVFSKEGSSGSDDIIPKLVMGLVTRRTRNFGLSAPEPGCTE